MDAKFINVLILGFSFMLLFTAFQTMSNIEKILLVSIHEDDVTFTGDGYLSLAIIYAAFSLSNWLAPSFISFTGPRAAMFVGGFIYVLFMVTFLFPKTWLLYLMSAILGGGAAIIWTGQGTFLARCSSPETISRHSGVFWALLQCSLFFGNLFVYFQFQDKNQIDEETRTIVISSLSGVAILGLLLLLTLRQQRDNSHENVESSQISSSSSLSSSSIVKRSALSEAFIALCSAVKLFLTRDMLLLSCTFLYTGFLLTFISGVYGSSIGFTKLISKTPKEIVGLAGICIGLGEVLGGSAFGILASKTARFGREPIVVIGYLLHMTACILTYLNLPANSSFGDTSDRSIFNPPQIWVALFCALIFGLGDACFNTQIYAVLGGVFVKESVAAFALFKFTQSIAAAAAFFYSSKLNLHFQLLILAIVGTIGCLTFCMVEISTRNRQRNTDPINDEPSSPFEESQDHSVS